MKILITGGAGFIGSNFIFHMLKNHPNDCIICLDKLTYAGNLCTLRPIMNQPNFSFVKVDICDREAIYRLFAAERPDMVVNFAAESHVDRSIDSPSIFYQTNVLGTVTLLEACRTYGIKRFHQVSTDEVYGDLPLSAAAPGFRRRTSFGRQVPTAVLKLQRILQYCPIIVRMESLSPSAAVPIIMAGFSTQKNSSPK